MSILLNFQFQFLNLRFFFYNFFLGISHIFVAIDLWPYVIDFLLDGFTEIAEEGEAVVHVFVFAVVEGWDVLGDVFVVEKGCAFLHGIEGLFLFIYCEET